MDGRAVRILENNREMAIRIRQLAQFVMRNADKLGEVLPCSDGVSAHYFQIKETPEQFANMVRTTVPVLFHAVEEFHDITYRMREDGVTAEVKRSFGRPEIYVTLIFAFDPNLTGYSETPQEIVESALIKAWQAHYYRELH